MLNCEDTFEDLEAFALGALDETAGRHVADHIAQCRDCAAIVHDYEIAIESLALSVPMHRASPRVKDRLLGGIGAFPAPALSMMRRRWWALSAAAVLLAFAIGGITWAIVLSSEVSQLRADNLALEQLTELDAQQREALLSLEDRLSSAQSEQVRLSTTLDEQATLLIVALDPDLVPTELAGTSLAPQASCNYVWSTKQSVGALTCKDLPSLDPEHEYKLWAIKGDRSVRLGAFLPRLDGTASLLVEYPSHAEGPVTSVWVTREEAFSQDRSPSTQVVLEPVPGLQASRE